MQQLDLFKSPLLIDDSKTKIAASVVQNETNAKQEDVVLFIEENVEQNIDKQPDSAIKQLKKAFQKKQTSTKHADIGLLNIPSDDILFQKHYYSISEVAAMFDVNTSLIRFWENEFDILQPRKNRKGDRLFTPQDIKTIELIYHLLRQRKFTISGAKVYLKKNKKAGQQHLLVQSLQQIKNFLFELKATIQ